MTTVVSFSEVLKWQTCQRQYYYRFNLGLSPIEESGALATGNRGHKLLETFYELMREGKSKEEALELVTEKAKKLLDSYNGLDFHLLTAWSLVTNYIRETDFTTEALLIENRFLLPASFLDYDPILADVQIGFTPDLVTKRKGNRVDIEDAKFVQRAWSKSKINRFPQLKLYQIFMEQMGYDISRTLIRFFNVQTSKVTEKPYVTTAAEKKILTHDFMSGVKEVVRYKSGNPNTFKDTPRTMNYTACQYCSFEFVCSLQAEGKDASRTIATQFEKSNYDYTR